MIALLFQLLEVHMENIVQINLISATGFKVTVLNLGGIITHIMSKNREGLRENVVLNYDDLNDYLANPLYLGCIVGPIAGRTRNGLFHVENTPMQLDTSSNISGLHSGNKGLNQVFWKIHQQSADSVVLTYQDTLTKDSKDFIQYQLTYRVNNESLIVDLKATSEKASYLSLTNHSYFNLSADSHQTILGHELSLNCSHFAELDSESLPIRLCDCKGSIYDFTQPKALRDVVLADHPTVKSVQGIDHPFKCASKEWVAQLHDTTSGRIMTVQTTQPYVVIYTGNFLHTGTVPSGTTFNPHTGICFETQDLPDVVNHHLDQVQFVTPKAPYTHQTVYSFSIDL